MYDLRVHSLRKYFKTQLTALGVNSDYIDYMMGHTISTYHDIQMKGMEFLRGIYASSGLSIKPKTPVSKIEALKEIMIAWGLNPEELLVKKAQAEPHRMVAGEDKEARELAILRDALKDMMKKELIENK